jgi:hypothetical protein
MGFTGASATIGGISGPIDRLAYDPITKVGTQTATPSGLTDSSGTSSFTETHGDSTTATNDYVASVTYALTRKGGTKLNVTVQVVDNLRQPVAAANVSITVKLNDAALPGIAAATTGSNGAVTFIINNAASGTYTTHVDSVTTSSPTLTWDAETPPNSYTIK